MLKITSPLLFSPPLSQTLKPSLKTLLWFVSPNPKPSTRPAHKSKTQSISTNPLIRSLAAAAAHQHNEIKCFSYCLHDRCPWNRCGKLVQVGAAQTGVTAPTDLSAQSVDTVGDKEVAGERKGKEVGLSPGHEDSQATHESKKPA